MRFQKSSPSLGAQVEDQIDDIAHSNMTNLQDLNETTFLKSYETDHINFLMRKEMTFENIIFNKIEMVNNKMPVTFEARLSK